MESYLGSNVQTHGMKNMERHRIKPVSSNSRSRLREMLLVNTPLAILARPIGARRGQVKLNDVSGAIRPSDVFAPPSRSALKSFRFILYN